jgi:hypothetical protein
MKQPLLILLLAALPVFAADDAALLKGHGTLLFEDDFNRDEPTPDKEAIGNGWTSNSATRAKGTKQVDLDGGAMHVTKAVIADHGVAIFHDVASQDGAVQFRFKLGEGDDLGLDFVDRELKTVHAGHLCIARVTLKNLSLTDSKTGGMANEIHDKRVASDTSPEIAKLFNLKADPFEQKNFAASEPKELRRMMEGLVAELDREQAVYPVDKDVATPMKPVLP